MACHLHPILCTWDAVTTYTPVTVFFPLGPASVFTLAYHTLHTYGLSLIVKVCALAACSPPGSVCLYWISCYEQYEMAYHLYPILCSSYCLHPSHPFLSTCHSFSVEAKVRATYIGYQYVYKDSWAAGGGEGLPYHQQVPIKTNFLNGSTHKHEYKYPLNVSTHQPVKFARSVGGVSQQ